MTKKRDKKLKHQIPNRLFLGPLKQEILIRMLPMNQLNRISNGRDLNSAKKRILVLNSGCKDIWKIARFNYQMTLMTTLMQQANGSIERWISEFSMKIILNHMDERFFKVANLLHLNKRLKDS
jgi:hypothetical protein